MPYAKHSIKVKIPNKSGFDKSHRNSGTLNCGTITPILCDEVIPGTRASLRLNLAAQFPPLVSDTYMNCKLKTEAFFVPSRLLCASFEDWFNDFPMRVVSERASDSAATFQNVTGLLPLVDLPGTAYDPGSLMDYLGFKAAGDATTSAVRINILPLVAYHLVWQEWYRNPRVQNPAFTKDIQGQTAYKNLAYTPYKYFYKDSSGNVNNVYAGASTFALADGVNLFSTRQRNFGLDYFTGARLSAQQGAPATVVIQNGIPDSTFSIAALRAANSLQMFRERNNIPSPRFVDQLRARYGVSLSDGVAQRPICIGSASYDIGTNGINQSAPDGAAPGMNPFSGVGAQYGRAFGAGSDFIIKDFTANEPGYILVNITIVPEVTYSTGIDPMFTRYVADGSIVEMANPILQNVGDEPILGREILEDATNTTIFGYQDRYGKFMYKPNIAHALFRDGENLAQFVLQRYVGVGTTLNSNFLTIPTTYLDDVLTVASATSGLCAWYDCLLDYKVSMPLNEFSIPSLQDPAYEHGKTISLHRNGQIF